MRLPLKLQYLICGRKRAGLLPIIEETSTNIYFPSPFVADTLLLQAETAADTTSTTATTTVTKDETSAAAATAEPAIYITGEPNHVSRVKDMLNKLAVQKVNLLLFLGSVYIFTKLEFFDRRNQCITKILHFMQEK